VDFGEIGTQFGYLNSKDISLESIVTVVGGALMRVGIEIRSSCNGGQGDQADGLTWVEFALPTASDHVA
jgi:hypothetical protein